MTVPVMMAMVITSQIGEKKSRELYVYRKLKRTIMIYIIDWSDPTDDWSDPTDNGDVSPTDDGSGEATPTEDWGATTATDDWSDPTDTAQWDTTTTDDWSDPATTTEWSQTETSSWSDPAATSSEQPTDNTTNGGSSDTPQPTESSQPSNDDSNGGTNKSAIIGGVVGGVGGALVLAGVVFFFIRRKRTDRGDVEEFQPQNEYDEPRTSWRSEGTAPNTPGTSMSQPFIQQLQLGGSRASMLPPPPPPQHGNP